MKRKEFNIGAMMKNHSGRTTTIKKGSQVSEAAIPERGGDKFKKNTTYNGRFSVNSNSLKPTTTNAWTGVLPREARYNYIQLLHIMTLSYKV